MLNNISSNSSSLPTPSANQVIAGVALGAGIYHAVTNPISSPLVTTGIAGVYNNLIASVAAGSLVTAAKLKTVELSARALNAVIGWGKNKIFANEFKNNPIVMKKEAGGAPKKASLTKPSSPGIYKPKINKDILSIERKFRQKKALSKLQKAVELSSIQDNQIDVEFNPIVEDTRIVRATASKKIPLFRLYTGGADSHINPNVIRKKHGRDNDCFSCDFSNRRNKK